jgi:hypothetical protein
MHPYIAVYGLIRLNQMEELRRDFGPRPRPALAEPRATRGARAGRRKESLVTWLVYQVGR